MKRNLAREWLARACLAPACASVVLENSLALTASAAGSNVFILLQSSLAQGLAQSSTSSRSN